MTSYREVVKDWGCRCLYSPSCLEEVFSETQRARRHKKTGLLNPGS
jgi:hypothetical protein